MITLEDCIGLCGANPDVVEQVARREGESLIQAAARLHAGPRAANESLASAACPVPMHRLAA